MSVYQSLTTGHTVRAGIVTLRFGQHEYHEVYCDSYAAPVAISRPFPDDSTNYHVHYAGQSLRTVKRICFATESCAFDYTEVSPEELQDMVDKMFIDYALQLMDKRLMGVKS